MIKNKNSIFDIFVKKIWKKSKKIFHKSEIQNIWLQSWWSERRLNYAINLLKNQDFLVKVAKDFYIFSVEKNENLDEVFWEVLDKIVKFHTNSGAILAWEKALEWQMMDFSVPQKLIVYTRDFSGRMRIFENREVVFQKIFSGERTGRKSVFSLLKKHSAPYKNGKNVFLLNAEIALLEALSLREKNNGMNEILVYKFLQRHHKKLQKSVFSEVVEYRYIRAINRLRAIAKSQNYDELYHIALEVIKKNGAGCFVSI